MASPITASKKVFLISGCSSGMGLAFANAALAAGHIVIATSRNPSKSEDLVSEFTSKGSHWLPLDLAAPEETLNAQVDNAIALYGRIDVLINNAGAAHRGTIELTPMDDVRKVFETNVFGTWAVTKKIVPVMREQKSGMIITNSSILGFMSAPTAGMYSAAKHALNGLMDTLSAELLPFGVRVVLLEPGGVRTDFVSTAPVTGISDAYKGTLVEAIPEQIVSQSGKEPGDPNKVAQRIIEAVDGTGVAGAALARSEMPLGYAIRIPIGLDAAALYDQHIKVLTDTLKNMEEVCKSTDFDDVTAGSNYLLHV